MIEFHLDTIWHDADQAMEFVLTNLSDKPISEFHLFYGSLTRTLSPSVCSGAQFIRRQANYHEYAPNARFSLRPGNQWRFVEKNLSRSVVRANEGPRSAGLIMSDGTIVPIECADLQNPPQNEEFKQSNAEHAVLPWPKSNVISRWHRDPVFHFGVISSKIEELRTIAEVSALAKRLFPIMPSPFVLAPAPGTLRLEVDEARELAGDSYELSFENEAVHLRYGPGSGLLYGLISLAQMMQGSQQNSGFAMPCEGHISDSPRHEWRGSHLDVSRQFYPVEDVIRFVDILAWHKLNRFHWHLSDDEGWRIEITAFPQLTDIAAHNGFDFPILPQLGSNPLGQGGFYTQEQAKSVVAHAARLGVDVMPEIDIPGHCASALGALPELVDPDEPESYWSLQGYANNALNPGVEATYDFVHIVLSELCTVFPSKVIHIGGDEVADNAWLQSPKAQVLMQEHGLPDTYALQSYFLGKVQDILTSLGRVTGGWEEVALGNGLDPENALLFAWTEQAKTTELAKRGYDVVSTPGQAYYLDMAQSDAWNEPGASWAGSVSVQTSYDYEAESEDPDLRRHLKGVQACIWSEYLTSTQRFNHMVFPRLSAIAEAAWTSSGQKDFGRFLRIAELMPKL